MSITGVKGFNDILPGEVEKWQHIEAAARRVFELYGFAEIRIPILEKTDLFRRSIGDTTDIVEKEMYSFVDKGENEVTMRPEGTASGDAGFHRAQDAMPQIPSPALLHRADVPLRAPAEGALPPVPPDRRRDHRGHRPAVDAQVLTMLCHFSLNWGSRNRGWRSTPSVARTAVRYTGTR